MPTDAAVTIQYDSNPSPTLTVSPISATVQGQGRVQWTLSIPTGWYVEVLFTPIGGKTPFPSAEYSGTSEAPITTSPADYGTNGTWPYTVKLYDGSTQRAQRTDADVVIQDNP